MTDMIERNLDRLARKLSGRLSRPGQQPYAAATAIWAKPVGRMPRVVAHCQTAQDVQAAIQTARDCELPLSVRGGGHDWAGRALCEGLVIDLSGMNGATVDLVRRTAQVAGGARAADVLTVTDPLGLAVVTGSCSSVGMAGLTLGGGYGSLIGRFGLALDNLLAAEVVLADGRIVSARQDSEAELFWALRGGGGNFGVVTTMQCRLHDVPSVRSGMLFFPFGEAKAVLEGCVSITASAPEALTAQLGLAGGPDGTPLVMVVPTWCGPPEEGEARLEPFSRLGTVITGAIAAMSYRNSLAAFDPFIVTGQRVFMESCWLLALDNRSIDVLIQAMAAAVSPGCAIFTHEFRGAASRVPIEATAFGLRRDHVLVELLATYADRSSPVDEDQHRRWVQDALHALSPMALPGGYPNFLPSGDVERATNSYGCNVGRLINAKRHYDPDGVFGSAIPLPTSIRKLAAE